MGSYTAVRMSETQLHAITWIKFSNLLLSKRTMIQMTSSMRQKQTHRLENRSIVARLDLAKQGRMDWGFEISRQTILCRG